MSELNIISFPMKAAAIGNTQCGNPIYFSDDATNVIQKQSQREAADGIYADNSTYLQPLSNGNMTVTVKAGYAHIQGVQIWVKSDETFAVEAAGTTDRVDRIVLRLSIPEKNVVLAIKKADTSLTRVAGQTWELGLADITVAANAMIIDEDDITDLRVDKTACGFIYGDLTVDDEYESLNTQNKKVLGAINELHSDITDGWIKVADTWYPYEMNEAEIPIGTGLNLRRGDAIKLKQDGVQHYFYCIGVDSGAGHVFVTGGSDHVLWDDGAITDVYYSHVRPKGFPQTFNWTPSVSYTLGTTDPNSMTINGARFHITPESLVWFDLKATMVRGSGDRPYTIFSVPFSLTNSNAYYQPAWCNWTSTDGFSICYASSTREGLVALAPMAKDGEVHINLWVTT